MSWIYENTADNSSRFILGEMGTNPLFCIGVNPSTATPEKLDPTLATVKRWAQRDGYDGWIMLNLYPQRSTNPNELHKDIDTELHKMNLLKIREFMKAFDTTIDIWAAWGGLINKRTYLYDCLSDICLELNACNWLKADSNTKHPHHPLYLKGDTKLVPFEISEYKIVLK